MNTVSANQKLINNRNIGDNSPATVTRSNQFTVNITGRPNTTYTLFIMGDPCNLMEGTDCNQPPMIFTRAAWCTFDTGFQETPTYPIGNQLEYPVHCQGNTTVSRVVPKNTPTMGQDITQMSQQMQLDAISVGLAHPQKPQ